jgi:GNAT superfamily N-acetyltransferase
MSASQCRTHALVSASVGSANTAFRHAAQPSARGRGVASALIATALRAGAADGCVTAGLDVDSDNVTGALRLYERLGFTTTRTQVSWSLDLPPSPERRA